ncbi:MAG: hypothetical protein LBP72_04315 [Dysgonamonadaceae bacterium]|jgi:hypothetical protein|nr:hypothetical protein [Dysgonamonadaceae bacterium]
MAKTLSAQDAQFNIEQRVITDKVASNIKLWNIPDPWFSSTLVSARKAWETAWAAYNSNPAERTQSMTFAKNATRKVYEPMLRQLCTLLIGNPNVTDADLETMGIVGRRQGKHYPPVPVPTDVPDFRIEQAPGHRLLVHFHAHEQERESSAAKPHGVHGAELIYSVLETPPTSYDNLTKSAFDTASPYTFTFDLPDTGKTLYVAVRWENSRGEKGPWSNIQSAIIP